MTLSPLQNEKPTPTRRFWRTPILGKTEVAPRHFQLRLGAPGLAQLARPGQFLHVKSQPIALETSISSFGDPLLRRAFSIMAADDEAVEILFRVEGQGTALLAGAHVGEFLDILGPLGQGFDIGLFHVKHNTPRAILVGGGVGVPPLVFLAAHLKTLGANICAILGARTGEDVLCEKEFADLDVPTEVCTDDGSRGLHGRVTDLLKPHLQKPNALVLACGPLLMLRAVAELCQTSGQQCQVSLEENMPCGVGVCNGCVVRVRPHFSPESDDYRLYRRICVEGPVCRGEEIDWEDNSHGG